MAQPEKKISFGFSKTIKKPELNIKAGKGNEKKIDYIECVDEKSIKVIGEDVKKEELLIIPMLGSKSWHGRIVNKINGNVHKDIINGEKEVINEKKNEGSKQNSSNIAENPPSTQESKSNLSLEEQAAQEIINDLAAEQTQTKNENLVIDQVSDLPSGSQESTLENYEEIPIEKFGIAMLRGMGWNPDEGIGKNAQVIKSVTPTLRPKGIGLGADKIFQKNSGNVTTNDVKLKLEKGGYVKIVAGNHQNNYGIVESFDDNSGRIIVKISSTDKIVSLSEVLVQPITKSQYEKDSRVINVSAYEKYKNETNNTTTKNKEQSSDKSRRVTENHMKNNSNSTKKESQRTSSSSDEYDSDNEKNHRGLSKKRSQSKKKKKSHDSERYSRASEFCDRIEKKRHKKEKKRHKDEKHQSHKHKRSRSRTSRR